MQQEQDKLEDKLIITLDGPSGSGKSTVSHRLARHFGIPCLDTGAMYRTVGWIALQEKIPLTDEKRIAARVKDLRFRFSYRGIDQVIHLEDRGKTREVGKEIRTPEVSMAASAVAKLKQVRQLLVDQQRQIGLDHGAVVEGRDAGTVIFPQARFKFFMTATSEERAKRRYLELKERLQEGAPAYDDVLKEMIQRDEQDSTRQESPLKPAADAQMIDTSGLDLDAVFHLLVGKIEKH